MAMVVNDVTATAKNVSQKLQKTSHVKSSITPFQKLLKQEESLYTSAVDNGSHVNDVQKSSSAVQKGETSLQSIFQRASEKYDISYDFLVAVAKAESDFNTKCVSSAGAQGIMQVMPDEQKGLGIKDPFDAEQNIMGAAKLLKAHLKKFNGDYTLAAAAYNAGSGRVQKYGGVPPFTETQNYVKKIEKCMNEGVTVPDVTVQTSQENTADGTSRSVIGGDQSFEQGKSATDADWEKVTVAVGTGDNAVTMSYGAYLKYLELGSTGVG